VEIVSRVVAGGLEPPHRLGAEFQDRRVALGEHRDVTRYIRAGVGSDQRPGLHRCRAHRSDALVLIDDAVGVADREQAAPPEIGCFIVHMKPGRRYRSHDRLGVEENLAGL
jgi:hypothetical protein